MKTQNDIQTHNRLAFILSKRKKCCNLWLIHIHRQFSVVHSYFNQPTSFSCASLPPTSLMSPRVPFSYQINFILLFLFTILPHSPRLISLLLPNKSPISLFLVSDPVYPDILLSYFPNHHMSKDLELGVSNKKQRVRSVFLSLGHFIQDEIFLIHPFTCQAHDFASY